MFCFPTDEDMKTKLEENSNLSHRNNFMRSLDVIFICMAIALGISIIYMLAVQFIPEMMNYAAVLAGTLAYGGRAQWRDGEYHHPLQFHCRCQ